jgi:hypothetical protein
MGIASVGHTVFAATVIVLGILGLIRPLRRDLGAVPKGVPAREIPVYLCALISLACGAGLLWQRAASSDPIKLNPLVLFGCYCLLIGYLIVRSTSLPRILGVLMACGGLGWLTFISPTVAVQHGAGYSRRGSAYGLAARRRG